MTKEELHRILTSHNDIEFIEQDGLRNHYFIVREVEYCIEWWVNVCYLHAGEMKIPFTRVELSGTWPNNFKLNLQFYNSCNKVAAILPVELYEKDRVNVEEKG